MNKSTVAKRIDKESIYTLPLQQRKNKFFESLARTKGDAELAIRRGKILDEMRGVRK